MNGFDNETIARWAAMGCCPTGISPEPALMAMVEEATGLREAFADADEMADYYADCLREAEALVEHLEVALLNDGDVTAALRDLKDCLEGAI